MRNETPSRRILLIDDESSYLEVLRAYLEVENFEIRYTASGEEALALVEASAFDLLLLDLNLPGASGIEVFKKIRAFSNIPVIMVTTRGEEIDRVVGLELGADDYVAKPFSPRELVARIKNVLRRATQAQSPANKRQNTHYFRDLEIDRAAYTARRLGKDLRLTPTEFRLLDTLAQHSGQVFSRSQLLDLISKDHTEIYDRTLDRHIANLRKKLEDDVHAPEFIKTVVGVGYTFQG